jgi:hypothetical protein
MGLWGGSERPPFLLVARKFRSVAHGGLPTLLYGGPCRRTAVSRPGRPEIVVAQNTGGYVQEDDKLGSA